mmetsp:Transcript_9833/g.27878  ORF Transcript_9833/g.27878 Transcript_9833/m.27878 type:complete len:217 (-) Transcript_9833:996-1646(-)
MVGVNPSFPRSAVEATSSAASTAGFPMLWPRACSKRPLTQEAVATRDSRCMSSRSEKDGSVAPSVAEGRWPVWSTRSTNWTCWMDAKDSSLVQATPRSAWTRARVPWEVVTRSLRADPPPCLSTGKGSTREIAPPRDSWGTTAGPAAPRATVEPSARTSTCWYARPEPASAPPLGGATVDRKSRLSPRPIVAPAAASGPTVATRASARDGETAKMI